MGGAAGGGDGDGVPGARDLGLNAGSRFASRRARRAGDAHLGVAILGGAIFAGAVAFGLIVMTSKG